MRSALIGAGTAAAGVVLASLLVLQGARVRRRMPRLPHPNGRAEGMVGGACRRAPVRLLVIGESTAADVGVPTHEHGLAANIARTLCAALARPVHWKTFGKVGATARAVREHVVSGPVVMSADVVVISLGVNDTLRFNTSRRWRRHVQLLIEDLRRCVGPALIMISPVPPLWKFRALPQPLRSTVGLRAAALDRAARTLARRMPDTVYVPVPFDDEAALLCRDRFHPSAAGYAVWGRCIGEATVHALRSKQRFPDDESSGFAPLRSASLNVITAS